MFNPKYSFIGNISKNLKYASQDYPVTLSRNSSADISSCSQSESYMSVHMWLLHMLVDIVLPVFVLSDCTIPLCAKSTFVSVQVVQMLLMGILLVARVLLFETLF